MLPLTESNLISPGCKFHKVTPYSAPCYCHLLSPGLCDRTPAALGCHTSHICRRLSARPLGGLPLEFHRQRQKRWEFNERQFKRALNRYRRIVRRGRYRYPRLASGQRRCAQSKAANLLDRLENSDLCVLAFLFDKRVPFTNNQGEQYIRMIKVRQKISGCFRTLRGAKIFCRIRSSLSTCRKQGRNVWEAIQMAVTGRPFIPSAPHAGP